MTGPISVTHPAVLQHLRTTGAVATVRSAGRTTGQTWLRYSRTDQKRADVTVTRHHALTTWDDLATTARGASPFPDGAFLPAHSGFGTAADWLAAIKSIHDTTTPDGLAVFAINLETATDPRWNDDQLSAQTLLQTNNE